LSGDPDRSGFLDAACRSPTDLAKSVFGRLQPGWKDIVACWLNHGANRSNRPDPVSRKRHHHPFARWPAVFGEPEEQLAPAGALLVTERELVVIAEEKEFSVGTPPEAPSAEESKVVFGGIITFVPRVRLKDFHVSHQENFGVLALQVQAAHGGDKLEFIFPSDNEKAVSQAMDQMLLSRASANKISSSS
jgi:hypothetical protein